MAIKIERKDGYYAYISKNSGMVLGAEHKGIKTWFSVIHPEGTPCDKVPVDEELYNRHMDMHARLYGGFNI